MTSILFGSNDGVEFGPPREKRSMRAFALAILAHLLLLGALTWGVNWKRSDPASSFEAELWSAVPQQAAPRAVEPPPPPPAPTPPAPTPPAPKPAPEPPKESPKAPDVDIALEQEKKRKLLEKQKEAEAKKLEERESREKAELQAKKEKEKEVKAKEEVAKRKAAEEAKTLEAKKQEAKDLKAMQQQKLADAGAKNQREDAAIKRMLAQAGGSGAADSPGTAQKSSGPSAGYNGKVAAKVKPNVVFTDEIAGNPKAEVEVSTTADGTIVSRRLYKSSGNKAWDEAVLKAIDRTGTLPLDVNGRVPTPMILEFRPKELL
jgi:colicin import membrane protein